MISLPHDPKQLRRSLCKPEMVDNAVFTAPRVRVGSCHNSSASSSKIQLKAAFGLIKGQKRSHLRTCVVRSSSDFRKRRNFYLFIAVKVNKVCFAEKLIEDRISQLSCYSRDFRFDQAQLSTCRNSSFCVVSVRSSSIASMEHGLVCANDELPVIMIIMRRRSLRTCRVQSHKIVNSYDVSC